MPAHDEEVALPDVLQALLDVLPAVAAAWEVIVVDDGSRDRTPTLVTEVARARRGVRVVRHRENRGYGAALRSGLGAARYPWVFLIDGDGQLDPRQLPRLCAARGSADVVCGYRVRRADAWARRLNTALWNRLVRTLFRLPVRDVNCAFKLVRRSALRGFDPHARGAMISAELLARLRQRGCRVVEVPVDHYPRRGGRASGAAPGVIVRAFVELVRLGRELR